MPGAENKSKVPAKETNSSVNPVAQETAGTNPQAQQAAQIGKFKQGVNTIARGAKALGGKFAEKAQGLNKKAEGMISGLKNKDPKDLDEEMQNFMLNIAEGMLKLAGGDSKKGLILSGLQNLCKAIKKNKSANEDDEHTLDANEPESKEEQQLKEKVGAEDDAHDASTTPDASRAEDDAHDASTTPDASRAEDDASSTPDPDADAPGVDESLQMINEGADEVEAADKADKGATVDQSADASLNQDGPPPSVTPTNP